jgi:hypothetical protein
MRISLPYRCFFLCFSLFFIHNIVLAQTPTQTVRGRLVNTQNEPMVSITVAIANTDFTTTTDTNGVFKWTNIPIGVYDIAISGNNKPMIVPNVRVEAGKETVLDMRIPSWEIDIDAITVTAHRPFKHSEISLTNQLANTILRYPATFNDPARAITYLAGAATDNDQGNNISVRGNTPNALQWYLEGAEIVNPNHLSNAGTPSDRTTANGGGVLILGTNLMDKATFYKGAMSADMGGALTSIMDLRLRKGNNQKRQNTLSIGLIGIEAGTEGYFAPPAPKGGDGSTVQNSPSGGGGAERASYLVHYRYSTIGLLSKIGVPLGDEAITFQDLSYNISLPTKKAGQFNIFGIHGLSDNIFAPKDSADETKRLQSKDWKTEKDSQDISYKNLMHAVGLRHTIAVGKMQWTSVAAYSGFDNSRNVIAYRRDNTSGFKQDESNVHRKLFVKSYMETPLSIGALQAGIAAKSETVEANLNSTKTNIKTDSTDIWLQPFAQLEGSFKGFTYRLGLRGSMLLLSQQSNIEPTFGVQYAFENSSRISLNASRQSQVLSPSVYSFYGVGVGGVFYKTGFHLTKSNNLNINYTFNIGKSIAADFGVFYQYQTSVPRQLNDPSTALDGLDVSPFGLWDNDVVSTGQSRGIELDINRSVNANGVHWRFNTTFYKSEVDNRNARFNGRYIVNGLIGKEWQFGKNKNKFWGINAHQIARGGFWETPINESLSIRNNTTVYNNAQAFSLQLKDYIRTDLSVYLKKSRAKWASTLQLDIQNLTNQQNEAWHSYDAFQKKVVTKYQLGIIPNLSYKVEF